MLNAILLNSSLEQNNFCVGKNQGIIMLIWPHLYIFYEFMLSFWVVLLTYLQNFFALKAA